MSNAEATEEIRLLKIAFNEEFDARKAMEAERDALKQNYGLLKISFQHEKALRESAEIALEKAWKHYETLKTTSGQNAALALAYANESQMLRRKYVEEIEKNDQTKLKLTALEQAHSEGNLARLVRERMNAENERDALAGENEALRGRLAVKQGVVEERGQERDRYKAALEEIARHAHGDRTCSLPAQGYSEVDCAEIGTKDHLAQIARTALKGGKPDFQTETDRLKQENVELVEALEMAFGIIKESAEEYTAKTGRHMWCYTQEVEQKITEALARNTERKNDDPLAEIYGTEITFSLPIPRSQLIEKCQDIWNNPEKYSDYKNGSDAAYYDFLKYLRVKDGESDTRLTDIVLPN